MDDHVIAPSTERSKHLAAGTFCERLPALEISPFGCPYDEDLARADAAVVLDALAVQEAKKLAVRGVQVHARLGDEPRAVENGERAAVLERPGGEMATAGAGSATNVDAKRVVARRTLAAKTHRCSAWF